MGDFATVNVLSQREQMACQAEGRRLSRRGSFDQVSTGTENE
jgi:hypothetical protein